MKGFSATTIVIFSVLVLVSANTSQFAFADGNDSPALCLSSNANVFSDSTGGTTTVDAGAGNIILSICIKDGMGSFNNPTPPPDVIQHSQVITANGNYGVGSCYVVSGFPNMQMVTVTDNCGGMMAVSHVDYTVELGDMVSGHGGITDNTALLVSGSHLTASWMVPLIVSAIGIGVFVFTRK